LNRDNLIQKLKQDIAGGRAVIIAGTGVSIEASNNQKISGYSVASWIGLLKHGIEYCKTRLLVDEASVTVFNTQIESGSAEFLVMTAEGISARLSKSPGVFRAWLQDTVGSLEPTNPEILRALAALPCVLATLNYDGLFEKATSRREPVTWLRPDKVQNVLLGHYRNAILHLHGYFDEPESVVLGFASYAKVADDAHASTVLRSFLIDRTLLFVGCGGTVRDPNFFRLVEWAKDALKDVRPRHILLCLEDELDTVRADLVSAPWLEPLAYGKDYPDLAPFLRSLAPLKPDSEFDPNAEVFDVFLCYNSEDRAAVHEISQKLEEQEVKPCLDIRPGLRERALARLIENTKSAALFVGESGRGPWEGDRTLMDFISQLAERKRQIVPVALRAAKTTPRLPWWLEEEVVWVDFRKADPDPVDQLVFGITGRNPRKNSHAPLTSKPEVDVKELIPPKKKQIIEVVVPGNLSDFSEQARDRFLTGLSAWLEISEVKLTRAMVGSIRLHLEVTLQDADKIYLAAQSGQLANLGISTARLYPSIASSPDDEQRRQLLVLLNLVEQTWIDGLLKKSLYNDVLISLGKRSMDEAVEPNLEHVIEFSSQRSLLLLQDRRIATIFDATGLLLILGEPGSGKTTTLLELAANLVSRAKADPKERVPVVLNLSSWKRKQSLTEWIANELSQKYRIAIKIARSWLQNDYLVPLLDGLDEVTTTLQPDCVAAINNFIDESEPSGLVVCCRLMEYQWLPHRLKLNGAICLESVSPEEVGKYLDSAGSKLAALRETVKRDSTLQELAQTPLMLSMMSLACQGAGGDELAKQKGDSQEERRKQIFGIYVEQMFQRKGLTSLTFPKEKTIGWLSWLARKMREHSQSVFLVEGLQPSWLGSTGQRVAYGAVVALTIGLIFGLVFWLPTPEPTTGMTIPTLTVLLTYWLTILLGVGLGCWSESPQKNSIISGLIGGLSLAMIQLIQSGFKEIGQIGELIGQSGAMIGGLIGAMIIDVIGIAVIVGLIGGLGAGSLSRITLVETVSWNWNQFRKKLLPGLVFGVMGGLSAGLIGGLIFGLTSGLSRGLIPGVIGGLFFGLMFGLSFGLIFGLIGALVSGCVGGWTDTVKLGKTYPNQGINLSAKNALTAFLVTGLIFELVFGLIFGLIGGLIGSLTFWLIFGLLLGLIFGLILSLNRGGSAVIKHYALRLALWLNGYTPFKFVNFLDYCAGVILLKKVGGGYIFVHRMLLEYFAELPPRSGKAEDGQRRKASGEMG